MKSKGINFIATTLCLILVLSLVSAIPTSVKTSNAKKANYQSLKPFESKQTFEPAKITRFSSNKAEKKTNQNFHSNIFVSEKNESNTTILYECKGDINLDNKVDFLDIDYFNFVRNYPSYAQQYLPNMYWRADILNDSLVNQLDVDPFVSLMGKPLENCRRLIITQPPFPQNWTYCKGDFNADSKIDFSDIDLMSLTLSNPQIVSQNTPWFFANADTNNDALIDQTDLNNFVTLLGTNCPIK